MRRGKYFTSAVAVVALVFAAALVAIAVDKGPDVMSIKAGLWPTPTKAPVEFTHKKHYEDHKIACADCHHVYKDGKNVWKEGDPVEKCEKCHTEPTIQGEKKLPPDQQKLNLKIAFHDNCQGCHQKLKKENPETKAPVTCAQCHPAQKP
ncbi:MAG: cytochrome c3 family protein [Syntrophobacteraceae bacterium]|nr:cytochrome c3 family protein [Syntrophobacteraceae bacterium]